MNVQFDEHVDQRIVESYDFDPCCESLLGSGRTVPGDGCDELAKWFVRSAPCPGCGRRDLLLCDFHKDHSLRQHLRTVWCSVCGKDGPRFTHIVYSVEAI